MKAYIISLNKLSKAFGIKNSGAKLGIIREEKNVEGYDEFEFMKEIFVNLSHAQIKKISSAKLKLVFRVISKFYKSYLRFVTSSVNYVNGLDCFFL